MQHQCYQIASTLSTTEWRRFVAYARLNSPRYGPDLAPVIDAIEAQHPLFQAPDAALWTAAFPGRAYSDPRLRILRCYLKDLLEEFLVMLELECTPVRKQLLLAKAMLRREGMNPAARVLKGLYQDLPQPAMKLLDWDHGLSLDELCLDLAVKQGQVGPEYPWMQSYNKIKELSLVKQLYLLSGVASTKGFFTNESSHWQVAFQAALGSVTEEQLERQPLLAIYHRLLLILVGQGDAGDPMAVMQLLSSHASAMDIEDRINVLFSLVNHFFEQHRQRVPGSLEMAFKVFQEMYRQDILFGLGVHTEVTIRNILQVGIRLGELEWIRDFLEMVHERLPTADRERVFRYGSAQLAFGEGKFAEAKRHLARFEITTSAERLYHDNLLMRICYELNDRDGLEVISSVLLRHLYRKEKIAESTKKAAVNLAKAVLALFDQRWSHAPKMTLPELKAYLDNLQPISHIDWVQAKLGQLEAGR